jgi:hypothetical protein
MKHKFNAFPVVFRTSESEEGNGPGGATEPGVAVEAKAQHQPQKSRRSLWFGRPDRTAFRMRM